MDKTNITEKLPLAIAVGAGVLVVGLVGIQAAAGISRLTQQPPQPLPIPTPSPALSPSGDLLVGDIPSPLPTPSPSVTPQAAISPLGMPEGYWVEVVAMPGYTHWNLRDKPQGQSVGLVAMGSRLYTDNRVYGRWQSVQCPPDLKATCEGWAWINIAAIKPLENLNHDKR